MKASFRLVSVFAFLSAVALVGCAGSDDTTSTSSPSASLTLAPPLNTDAQRGVAFDVFAQAFVHQGPGCNPTLTADQCYAASAVSAQFDIAAATCDASACTVTVGPYVRGGRTLSVVANAPVVQLHVHAHTTGSSALDADATLEIHAR